EPLVRTGPGGRRFKILSPRPNLRPHLGQIVTPGSLPRSSFAFGQSAFSSRLEAMVRFGTGMRPAAPSATREAHMAELLCSRSSTGADSDSLAIAVRPSRVQIAAARLSLLLNGKEGRLPIGLATFAIGVGLSIGGLQFLQFALRYGVLDALRICACGIASLTLLSTAGGAALLVHAARGGGPPSRLACGGRRP